MGPEKRGYKITAVAPHVDYQQKNERKEDATWPDVGIS